MKKSSTILIILGVIFLVGAVAIYTSSDVPEETIAFSYEIMKSDCAYTENVVNQVRTSEHKLFLRLDMVLPTPCDSADYKVTKSDSILKITQEDTTVMQEGIVCIQVAACEGIDINMTLENGDYTIIIGHAWGFPIDPIEVTVG